MSAIALTRMMHRRFEIDNGHLRILRERVQDWIERSASQSFNAANVRTPIATQ
jgi:hypothetical protein